MGPDPTVAGLSRGEQDILRRAAASAPSLEPVSSWWLRVDTDTLDVCADPATLDGPAERARRLHVSAGAALVNLRVAARRLGRSATVALLPGPASAAPPGLLARAVVCAGVPPTLDEAKRYAAIPSRRAGDRSDRCRQVPAALLSRLADAAAVEGARLCVVPERNGQPAGDHVGHPAEDSQRPVWALLGTDRDDPADWLRAGQALQQILLLATVHGAAASLVEPPCQASPDSLLGNAASRPGTTQVVLRLG